MYEQNTASVLRVLNEALLRQRGDYRFTTLVYCVLDLSGERPLLRVSCGGHPRPLLLRLDGTTKAVGAIGPLAGVLSDAHFTEQQIELEDGDVLTLYTDGLTDALAPDVIIEEADLLRTLSSLRGKSAGEVAAQLEHLALGGDTSQPPRDDIALLVAKLV